MTFLSKRLEEAVAVISTLPLDQQDLIALELAERARVLSGPAVRLNDRERAELEAELAAARRGELASDAEVTAMYAKHGL